MAKGPAEVAFGPMLIGTMLNILMLGVMSTQTFLYFTTYKSDRTWMKVLVGTLFLADTVNCVFDVVYIYDSLILHFADVTYLQTANWVFATDPAMTGMIAGTVQLFFAYRVHVLAKKPWLTAIIVTCAGISFLSGIGTAIAIKIVPHYVDFQKFKAIVIVWLVPAAFGDILITVTLVWYLNRHRTGFAATDDVVNKIIRLTVQTGLLTALVAIGDLVAFLADPTGTHLILNFPMSKLYTNSLMSTLNSRVGGKYAIKSGSAREPDVLVIGGQSTNHPELTIHIEQTVEHHEMGNQKTDQVSQTISADEQHWDTKARPFDDEV